MRGAPISPEEYAAEDGLAVLDDEALMEGGWASGLRVWEQVGKAYEWYFSQGGDHPDGLDNAQMWSLRKAIRRELLEELGLDVSQA